MTEEKFAGESVVTGAELMTPNMANLVGNIHGGHVTFLADNLAMVCASRYAGAPSTSARSTASIFTSRFISGNCSCSPRGSPTCTTP